MVTPSPSRGWGWNLFRKNCDDLSHSPQRSGFRNEALSFSPERPPLEIPLPFVFQPRPTPPVTPKTLASTPRARRPPQLSQSMGSLRPANSMRIKGDDEETPKIGSLRASTSLGYISSSSLRPLKSALSTGRGRKSLCRRSISWGSDSVHEALSPRDYDRRGQRKSNFKVHLEWGKAIGGLEQKQRGDYPPRSPTVKEETKRDDIFALDADVCIVFK